MPRVLSFVYEECRIFIGMLSVINQSVIVLPVIAPHFNFIIFPPHFRKTASAKERKFIKRKKKRVRVKQHTHFPLVSAMEMAIWQAILT
jgi:hypothetical protein